MTLQHFPIVDENNNPILENGNPTYKLTLDLDNLKTRLGIDEADLTITSLNQKTLEIALNSSFIFINNSINIESFLDGDRRDLVIEAIYTLSVLRSMNSFVIKFSKHFGDSNPYAMGITMTEARKQAQYYLMRLGIKLDSMYSMKCIPVSVHED